ncbi:MAG: alpha-L-fucosidase [Prevotella sp.]|nr:alpha-L-fucosidase [Prevotella sp.]
MKRYLVAAIAVLSSVVGLAQQAPKAIGPLPKASQVEWQKLETYAFIHFGPNTFGDREWGYGDASLESFNPTRLDCEQWARTVKGAGMKGIILTAKHHDGFCLWPTRYTDYSVRNTPYKQGKGDVVGELAAACKKYGLKLGLYLSPWDRHQAFYGTALYREYFYAQLHELLTQYGELFEVWFDGANGGDGWYGGAKETRKIDRRTYYDFPRAWAMVDKLQPKAQIFSDGGPGCRWVGNEDGYAFATNWSFLRSKEVYPGYDRSQELQQGHRDGDKWIPAECNVSIRPGWFYHEKEDCKVKSVDELVDLYYRSVGHNGTQLINFPVNKEGLIHPIDSANAANYYKQISAELKNNLVLKASVKASNTRGKNFSAKKLTDGNYDTYWATADGVTTGSLTIDFNKTRKLNRMMLQEYIPLGQRVEKFRVEYLHKGEWLPVNCGEETTTIGYKRLLRFKTIEARKLRVVFEQSRGELCINNIGVYYAPGTKERYIEKPSMLEGIKKQLVNADATSVLFEIYTTNNIKTLYYLPDQSANHEGLISDYEILVGDDLSSMHKVTDGQFANIRNHPILQEVHFTPTKARYVMLKSTRMVVDGQPLKYDNIAIE